jgi:hypothetical protein
MLARSARLQRSSAPAGCPSAPLRSMIIKLKAWIVILSGCARVDGASMSLA